MRTRGARVAGFLLLGCWMAAPALAEQFTVTAGNSEILFDEASGVPVRWVLCESDCRESGVRRTTLLDEGDGYFRVTSLGERLVPFSARVTETNAAAVVEFRSEQRQYLYRISRTEARISLELPAGAGLELASGESFVPEQLPGFGQIYSRVKAVQVDDDGQRSYEEPDDVEQSLRATRQNWTGVRSRYWTALVQPVSEDVQAVVELNRQDRPVVRLASSDSGMVAFEVYAGPVEWRTLRQVAPELSGMLFAALWDFLRWLCFGMLLLLEGLHRLTGSYGLAIILLSLSAKILMSPLTLLADRWQAEVNRQHSLLKPELDAIKREFKGEEAHRRVLEVYKKHSVSQLYTFKSAAGFLIQIPVFIAAFDMLAENFVLNEMSFLWMSDLAKPDRFAALPLVVPFFGGWLNLLPFLMTGLSALAAWLQAEETLTQDLQRQQSIRLYLMSAAFFVLFYTFPAGMVLYWTSSNLFHLIKVESGRLFRRGPQ